MATSADGVATTAAPTSIPLSNDCDETSPSEFGGFSEECWNVVQGAAMPAFNAAVPFTITAYRYQAGGSSAYYEVG